MVANFFQLIPLLFNDPKQSLSSSQKQPVTLSCHLLLIPVSLLTTFFLFSSSSSSSSPPRSSFASFPEDSLCLLLPLFVSPEPLMLSVVNGLASCFKAAIAECKF
ncbi:hypothetical protein JOB18_025818 [Solea senegalensis]|nr:hypothetical protein JOB18_025818 [Solea senegalensis]